ncbi:hypothetical protein BKA62DRAFT_676675 [Auriculariales sp. MPI-PUGE-AT-0066]|nr:hypothetical protein BKA62DRAFT_676675 [Auriculariales sp. MPI-PUGE-AT-0066]
MVTVAAMALSLDDWFILIAIFGLILLAVDEVMCYFGTLRSGWLRPVLPVRPRFQIKSTYFQTLGNDVSSESAGRLSLIPPASARSRTWRWRLGARGALLFMWLQAFLAGLRVSQASGSGSNNGTASESTVRPSRDLRRQPSAIHPVRNPMKDDLESLAHVKACTKNARVNMIRIAQSELANLRTKKNSFLAWALNFVVNNSFVEDWLEDIGNEISDADIVKLNTERDRVEKVYVAEEMSLIPVAARFLRMSPPPADVWDGVVRNNNNTPLAPTGFRQAGHGILVMDKQGEVINPGPVDARKRKRALDPEESSRRVRFRPQSSDAKVTNISQFNRRRDDAELLRRFDPNNDHYKRILMTDEELLRMAVYVTRKRTDDAQREAKRINHEAWRIYLQRKNACDPRHGRQSGQHSRDTIPDEGLSSNGAEALSGKGACERIEENAPLDDQAEWQAVVQAFIAAAEPAADANIHKESAFRHLGLLIQGNPRADTNTAHELVDATHDQLFHANTAHPLSPVHRHPKRLDRRQPYPSPAPRSTPKRTRVTDDHVASRRVVDESRDESGG